MSKKPLEPITSWLSLSLSVYFKKENLIYLTKFGLLQTFLNGFLAVFITPEIIDLISPDGVDLGNPKLPFVVAKLLVYSFFYFWLYLSTISAVSRVVDGKEFSVTDALKRGLSKMLKVFFIVILIGVAFLIVNALFTFLILIVGAKLNLAPSDLAYWGEMLVALPFATWFYFSHYIVITTDTGVIASLKESKALSKGRFWNILGRFIIFFLYMQIVSIAIALILSYMAQVFVSSLIAPYFILTPYLLYRNVKDTK